MTVVLALALLAAQAPASFPVGTSPEFAKAAMAVEGRLTEGDVPGAREAARSLPVRRPRVAWNDRLLPEALKGDRQTRLDAVVARWAKFAKGFAPQPSGDAPDLAVELAPTLSKGPGDLPLAVSVEPGPPFRAKIGLTLGDPGLPLRSEDLAKAEAYLLGRYLGVPESPFPNTAMHADPRADIVTFMPVPQEAQLAAQNLDLADRLRAAVEAGRPLGLNPPVVRLTTLKIDLGTVEQGRPAMTRIEVENLGAGPLDYLVTPDCSCFGLVRDGTVASQGRKAITMSINTESYVGRQDKMVLLQTNDPERPSIEVPVTFRVRPAYRLFRPGGDKVAVPAKGGAYDYFLFFPPDSPLHFVSARWEGTPAKVTWVPWSGALADPDMQEGPLPRAGWRFRIVVPPNLPLGRGPEGALAIRTDSPIFPVLRASLYVQRGIVADDLNMGDLTPGRTSSLVVDRPKIPFKILGVDAKPLRAKWTDRGGGAEYRIELTYPGGAQKGDLVVPVRIHTDDPQQPVVEALVHGYVR